MQVYIGPGRGVWWRLKDWTSYWCSFSSSVDLASNATTASAVVGEAFYLGLRSI